MAADSSQILLGVRILQAAITCGPMFFKAALLNGQKLEIRASFAAGKRRPGKILAFRLIFSKY
jgi:hypothetical protein